MNWYPPRIPLASMESIKSALVEEVGVPGVAGPSAASVGEYPTDHDAS